MHRLWWALVSITRVKRKIQIGMVVCGSRRGKFIVRKSTYDSHLYKLCSLPTWKKFSLMTKCAAVKGRRSNVVNDAWRSWRKGIVEFCLSPFACSLFHLFFSVFSPFLLLAHPFPSLYLQLSRFHSLFFPSFLLHLTILTLLAWFESATTALNNFATWVIPLLMWKSRHVMHIDEPVSFLRVRIWLSSPLLLLVLWLSKRCQFSIGFSSLSLLWMASLSTSWVPFGAATSGYSSIPDMMSLKLWYKNVAECIAYVKVSNQTTS